jgi:ribosomal protein S3
MTLAFKQKNAPLFLKWVVRFMERIRPRIHKRFISFFRIFLVRLFTRHAALLGYAGFKLTIKGKISVGGNAKKRTQRITCGTCSLTTKNQSISYAHRIVHTYTGVLGLKCFIFY